MKNIFKLFAIVILLAVLIILLITCENMGLRKTLGEEEEKVVASSSSSSVSSTSSSSSSEGSYWVKTMGDLGNDNANDIIIDSMGNIYITGGFNGTVNFDPEGAGDNKTSLGGDSDIFITKFDNSGNYLWTKTMGTPWIDGSSGGGDYPDGGIEIDNSGNFYIAGHMCGGGYTPVDYNPDPIDTDIRTYYTDQNSFITKFDSDFNYIDSYVFPSMSFGSYQQINGIGFDNQNNIYTCGTWERNIDFDPSADVVQRSANVYNDYYFHKLNSNGTFGWVNIISTNGNTFAAYCQKINNSNNNFYIIGAFNGSGDFDPGTGTVTLNGGTCVDFFITKFNSDGSYVWTKTPSEDNESDARALMSDSSGNLYIGGLFKGTIDFDFGAGTASETSKGNHDIFLLQLDNSGNFSWVKSFGSTSNDSATSLFINPSNGNIFITGYFRGTVDFDPNIVGVNNIDSKGGSDIFISEFDSLGNYIRTWTIGGSLDDCLADQKISIYIFNNKLYIVGGYQGTVDFNPFSGVYEKTSNGLYDIFLLCKTL